MEFKLGMEPSITESDWSVSDMYKSSQDSFRPSKHAISSTQEELFSSLEKEQFSSFKPKREHSITDTNRGGKKRVRFADDQDTPMPQSGTFDSEDYCDLPHFDLNATCPVEFSLDPETSFDATDTNTSPISTNQNVDSITKDNKTADSFQFNDSSYKQNSNHQSGNDPGYTYVMRELIVKKQNDLISYTYQNSYLDDDMNSSLQQSLLVNNDVTNPIVLEQKEQSENLKTGRMCFSGKRVENLGRNSKNIHISESFATKDDSNFSNKAYFYDLPNFSVKSPNFSSNFPEPSNQFGYQEFDMADYQSSQHSEFGNPFSENSDFKTSPQHSFSNHHDDEFVPKEFHNPEERYLYRTPNLSKLQDSFSSSFQSAYESDPSQFQFHTPNSTTLVDQQLDTSYSPIVSNLGRQLSLDSPEMPICSKISDLDYL